MTATVAARPAAAPRPIDRGAVLAALAGFLLLALALASDVSTRFVALLLLGGTFGVVLFHAAFGFTAGWRRFMVERRGAGLRAQFLAIAIAMVLFAPMLASGEAFGRGVYGVLGPLGVSVAVGGFLFGFGMQLAGGCGSGTLFTVGGGSVRMLVTLAFFVFGSLIGSFHLPWWLELPSLGWISLGRELGYPSAVAVQIAALVALGAGSWWMERRRHGSAPVFGAAVPDGAPASLGARLLRGPWPLIWGAVALAALNALTMIVAGHPWAITSGFMLWGAKIASAIGVEVTAWSFWDPDGRGRMLEASVLTNSISVMNFGVILGALLAAGIAGRFATGARPSARSILAAAIGGTLMGYGARLGFGCNIGAMFSGIASGSLHGWLWFAVAWIGSALAIPLRPRFGLGN
ncbi:MAG: YeeE/YedE family protein [Azospirillaceae bacterium]